MTREIHYTWKLRELMAARELYSTTDLAPLLEERGISLSPSQVYRLVTDTPERLSVKTLIAILDALDCKFEDLMESTVHESSVYKVSNSDTNTSLQRTSHGIGNQRPTRARIKWDDN